MEQTRRRQFLLASGALLVAPRTSFAQPSQGKVPRVGFLISETVTGTSSRIDAMRAGLRDRGYVDGKNIRIELRAADGRYGRLPELAQSLVHDKVDVIVAFGTKAMLAATSATKIIPIVDPVLGDPVASGQAASLARPGGNVTGLSTYGADISLKRLELFKEVLPRIGLLAVTINPANPSGMSVFQQLVPAAARLKVELKLFEAREAGDFDAMFAAMAKARVDSILMGSDTLFRSNDSGLAALAAKYRLPTTAVAERPTSADHSAAKRAVEWQSTVAISLTATAASTNMAPHRRPKHVELLAEHDELLSTSHVTATHKQLTDGLRSHCRSTGQDVEVVFDIPCVRSLRKRRPQPSVWLSSAQAGGCELTGVNPTVET